MKDYDRKDVHLYSTLLSKGVLSSRFNVLIRLKNTQLILIFLDHYLVVIDEEEVLANIPYESISTVNEQ